MPTISIFIRKDDLPKWQAIENKSAWLHDALAGRPSPVVEQPIETPAPITKLDSATHVEATVNVPAQTVYTRREEFVPKPPDPETGYPCCQSRSRRCKHWDWDGARGNWVNTLTGKELEE